MCPKLKKTKPTPQANVRRVVVADTLQDARVEFVENHTDPCYDSFVCNNVLGATPTQEVRMDINDCVKSDMVSEDFQIATVVVSVCVDNKPLCDTQSSIIDEMSPL